jgi:hypothetical protein
MFRLHSDNLLGTAGYAGLDGGLQAKGGAGEELLSATLFGTAQRDQATSTADLPGRGP